MHLRTSSVTKYNTHVTSEAVSIVGMVNRLSWSNTNGLWKLCQTVVPICIPSVATLAVRNTVRRLGNCNRTWYGGCGAGAGCCPPFKNMPAGAMALTAHASTMKNATFEFMVLYEVNEDICSNDVLYSVQWSVKVFKMHRSQLRHTNIQWFNWIEFL